MKFKIKVPATTANLGSGFDILGMALSLHNTFEFESSAKYSIDYNINEYAMQTMTKTSLIDKSKPEENLIVNAYTTFFRAIGRDPIPVRIFVDINIPLSRGLGSSATAILAGLFAGNEISRRENRLSLKADQILRLALQLEPHPDNLAAALYGGLCLCVPIGQNHTKDYEIVKIPVRAPVQLAGVIPHTELSTAKARSVLAQEVPLADVAYQASRASLWPYLLSMDGISKEDVRFWRLAASDKLHQQARAKFIPGLAETFRWWESLGAYAGWLSGAGTTLLGFWPKDMEPEMLPLGRKCEEAGLEITPIYPSIDTEGLIVQPH